MIIIKINDLERLQISKTKTLEPLEILKGAFGMLEKTNLSTKSFLREQSRQKRVNKQ